MEALGYLDMAHRENKILVKELEVLLNKMRTKEQPIHKTDNKGKGPKFSNTL